MRDVTQKRLSRAISMVTKNSCPSIFPLAFRFVIWELMKAHTHLKKLDKMIKKLQK